MENPGARFAAALRELYQKAASFVAGKLPDWCCGRREVLEEKYRSRYGIRDWKAKAREERVRTAGLYLLALILFLPPLILETGDLAASLWENRELSRIQKPAFGEPAGKERVKVHVEYQDIALEEELFLQVPAKSLTEGETREALMDCLDSMSNQILGKNLSLEEVESDLKLPASQGTIQLEWNSERPELISEKGEVNPLLMKGGETVILTVSASLNDLKEERQIPIILSLPSGTGPYEKALRHEVKELGRSLEQGGSTAGVLRLPKETQSGARLRWQSIRENHADVLLIVFLLALLLIFQKRYRRADAGIRQEREGMERDFPEFLNQVLLLLSAGLVVNAAFQRITLQYQSQKTGKNRVRKPLYEALAEVEARVRETNAPWDTELAVMARKSGIRELMRFSAIVSDNLHKGTALAEKLEAEGSLLWQGRKKEAERKGRTAETKLTFPLAILLLVLVVITTGPVMLEV